MFGDHLTSHCRRTLTLSALIMAKVVGDEIEQGRYVLGLENIAGHKNPQKDAASSKQKTRRCRQ